ncbi:hypothetical protein [Sinomonas mesophila]|uniref:hypothetical protein n=1 Tax=Sinomonas mesophila TaxID=1531955 RepID=UPI003CCC0883
MRGIRWVVHVDLDQFIPAVEVLRRPELAASDPQDLVPEFGPRMGPGTRSAT